MLTDRGLWPQEADAVLKSILASKNHESLAEVLSKAWDGYPKPFHAVSWMVARSFAVEYIDEHKPMHFARPMFAVKGSAH